MYKPINEKIMTELESYFINFEMAEDELANGETTENKIAEDKIAEHHPTEDQTSKDAEKPFPSKRKKT